MDTSPRDYISPEENEKALNDLIKHGISTQFRLSLTEGVFLVAFALTLGAPNSVIGLLAAIPFLAQLLQFPSAYLVERYRTRKTINLLSLFGNRMALLLMALIPFISTSLNGLILLIISVGTQAVFIAIGSPGFNSWIRDLVPQDQLGQFFSRRLAFSTTVGIPTALLASIFIDAWFLNNPDQPLLGYSVLFFFALLSGILGIYYILKIPEPKMDEPETRIPLKQYLVLPFKDTNFSNLMRFSMIWTLATSIAAPFFTVYLLRELGLGIPVAVGFTVITQIISVIFFRFWGNLSDRFSNKSVLQVTVPMFMVGTLLWVFTTLPVPHLFTIPLLVIIHLLTGVASAGVTLTSANIGLKLVPRGEATIFLAARGMMIAIAGSIGPFIGGLVADYFLARQFVFTIEYVDHETVSRFVLLHIGGLDFIFIISFIVGFYALHRLAYVRETGEVEEKVVIDAILAETRRGVKSLSTVDGLRHTFQIPIRRKPAREKKKKPTFE